MPQPSAPRWDDLATRVTDLVGAADPAPRFRDLWIALEPIIAGWTRAPWFLGRVADDEDLQREIVVRTWIKLGQREFACLRALIERGPVAGPQLRRYVFRVVKNLGIDYLRSLPELERGAGDAARWRDHVPWSELHEVANDNAPPSLIHRALDALDLPAARNPERRWYRPALELWTQGYRNDEIAAALGMPDGATADRVVDAAKQLLRRRFGGAA